MEYAVTTDLKKHSSSMHTPMSSDYRTMNMTPEVIFNELEALSYSISHDLRAPLRAIRSNSEWLSAQHAEKMGVKESTILQQITQSSEQMEKLLDGLLAFSRVVKSEPQYSAIDMTNMVHTVIDELMESGYDRSSFTIRVNPLLSAFGDPLLIHQVWYNLLSNALKYTRCKEQKEVEIISSLCHDEVVFSVLDNGIGFDMDYVNRLFSVFQRLHDAQEYEGTGVGLAIVKRIIVRHGGRVWAEGSVDQGAQFYFTLPRTY